MLNLTDRKWKPFYLRDIFQEIGRGKRLKTADHVSGDVPYVSSSAISNGVDDFVGNQKGVRKFKDCLTLANSGSVGETFYHPYEFVASDHVTALSSPRLNKYSYLFIATIMGRLREKYNFNREINDLRIRKEQIILPISADNEPDYNFMEQYIKEREGRYCKMLQDTQYEKEHLTPLREKEWQAFFIEDIAEILSGRDIYDAERTPGNIPYVSSSSVNNGVCHFVSNVNETLEAGCISVNRNGSVGYAFYHPYEALYSNDCRKLRLKVPNKYAALFITTQITAQRDKYSYGYKMGTGRLKRQKIILPVDENGAPDWAYMEAYVQQQCGVILQRYAQCYANRGQGNEQNKQ